MRAQVVVSILYEIHSDGLVVGAVMRIATDSLREKSLRAGEQARRIEAEYLVRFL
jgi:hypothetical protein